MFLMNSLAVDSFLAPFLTTSSESDDSRMQDVESHDMLVLTIEGARVVTSPLCECPRPTAYCGQVSHGEPHDSANQRAAA